MCEYICVASKSMVSFSIYDRHFNWWTSVWQRIKDTAYVMHNMCFFLSSSLSSSSSSMLHQSYVVWRVRRLGSWLTQSYTFFGYEKCVLLIWVLRCECVAGSENMMFMSFIQYFLQSAPHETQLMWKRINFDSVLTVKYWAFNKELTYMT